MLMRKLHKRFAQCAVFDRQAMWHIQPASTAACCQESGTSSEELKGTTMSRLTQMSPEEMSNSQALLVDVASKLGAPDPIIASIFVTSEIGRIWLRGWTEILNGGVLDRKSTRLNSSH